MAASCSILPGMVDPIDDNFPSFYSLIVIIFKYSKDFRLVKS